MTDLDTIRGFVNLRFCRKLYKDVKWADEYGLSTIRTVTASELDAEVVSSEIDTRGLNVHAPVLDLDVVAYLLPSTTPGHTHLYINHPIPWCKYKRMLKAMGNAGVLEQGYVEASIRRGHSSVRVPWLKKEKS